jgi:YVTN family beta-propeller protein
MVLSGRVLFVMNNEGNSISVIDTSTDDVVKTMSVGITPVFGVIDTGFLYSLDSKSNSVSTFNVKIPQLLEINTTAAAGKYTQNNSLTIKATFDIEPIPGSSMRLTLNTNRVILLDTVDGKSLTGIYTV